MLHTSRGALFCLSQRAEHIWEGVSSATTRSRPIINTRDEPHADAEKYRRLHVIVGDSNMSEVASYVKIGATAILLRMIEENVVMRDMTLENPIRAIREISHDMTCKRKVRLANGRELNAVQMQWEYFTRAQRYAEYRDLSDELKTSLKLWEQMLNGLESDPLSLDRELDWVMKYKLIQGFRERHSLPLGHPRIALVDLAYHDVHRGRGLYYMLEREGHADRMVTEQHVERAIVEAPQTTRARLRAEFIKEAKRRRRDYTVDWVHLKLNDQAQRTVLCKDPFKSEDDRVERLIASM